MNHFIYLAGDVVFFKNVMFKDYDGKERIDTRLNGHPFLILNDVEELGDKCYALKLTSKKFDKKVQYSLPQLATVPKLKKNSYVDLNNVYEIEIDEYRVPYGYLRPEYLDDIAWKVGEIAC